MHLEYDPAKRAANLRKHGIDLEDARPVLFDPCAVVRENQDAEREQRFIAVGLDALGRVLTVIYTYRPPDVIRLISARPATSSEKQAYEA
ncbi:hypothetical protein Thimo_3225 [Thioflavicoccus mobilis 8321]|uniref:BrnT family toxin n=1 Tax=Thioflavicoccus mobilis 8321 TaxID=765912 RepID=L0H2T7_9GAMM|nr:BrnT family toxin [Thioflavicoccus mobilis]AGA91904.1 hypothetical protein Thimo_3225 [Thioflavicoccus mobilis 8321]